MPVTFPAMVMTIMASAAVMSLTVDDADTVPAEATAAAPAIIALSSGASMRQITSHYLKAKNR